MKQVFAMGIGLLGGLLVGCDSAGTRRGPGEEAAVYPRKTVTIICPWAAGGGTDRLSRLWADLLEKRFGKPFVVVNKTGGSGAVGHSSGAFAAPDGYTVTVVTSELNTMHWMGITDLTYEAFQPIIQMNADAAALVVRTDAPWKNVGELLKAIQLDPGELKMSGTATGGAWDLGRAGLFLAAGLPINSIVWVPAKGAAPSLVELLGGHIDIVCCSIPEAAPQVEAGQLRILAVMSPERLAQFPDVPTVKEEGIDWEAVAWRGLAVPRDTPQEIVDRLVEQCMEIVESEVFREFMVKNSFAVVVREPSEFREFLQQQDSQWKTVIEAAGYAKK